MKLSKEKRDRLIAVTMGAVMVVGVLYYFVVNSRRAARGATAQRFGATTNKLYRAESMVANRERTEAELAKSQADLQAIEDSLADGKDLLKWSYSLMDRAKAAHKNVDILEVTRPSKGEVGVLAKFPYEAAIFTVRGISHYHDFGKFLADFENKFPYFRVQNLSMVPAAEAAQDLAASRLGKEKIQFTLEVVALIKPNQ